LKEYLISTAAKRLEWYAAKFLIQIRETCKMSHTALEHIIDGMRTLLADFSLVVLVRIFLNV